MAAPVLSDRKPDYGPLPAEVGLREPVRKLAQSNFCCSPNPTQTTGIYYDFLFRWIFRIPGQQCSLKAFSQIAGQSPSIQQLLIWNSGCTSCANSSGIGNDLVETMNVSAVRRGVPAIRLNGSHPGA